MTWVKKDNGDYEAKGCNGDFLVWKYGKIWKARYRTTNSQYTFFLPICRDLKQIKRLCEGNIYWEKGNN